MADSRPQTAEEEISRHQYFMQGVVDRIEGDKAVIRFDGGQELVWSKENLPPDAREGSAVRVLVTTAQEDTAERVRIAKALLNEILGSGGNPSEN